MNSSWTLVGKSICFQNINLTSFSWFLILIKFPKVLNKKLLKSNQQWRGYYRNSLIKWYFSQITQWIPNNSQILFTILLEATTRLKLILMKRRFSNFLIYKNQKFKTCFSSIQKKKSLNKWKIWLTITSLMPLTYLKAMIEMQFFKM